jgi:hypothetical protein
MTTKHKPGMTLDEHYAALKASGRYDQVMELKREREAARQALVQEMRVAEAPLVRDINATGYTVSSVWDLVNTANPYPEALPVLLSHLQRSYPVPIRDGIARALAVKDAKPGWSILLRKFRDEHELRAKDGLAAALSVIADDEHIDDLLALVRDRQYGSSRAYFLEKIAKSRDPRAQAVFSECANDPELVQFYNDIMARRSRNARRRQKRRDDQS